MSLKIINIAAISLAIMLTGCASKQEVISFNDINKTVKKDENNSISLNDINKIAQEVIASERIITTITDSSSQNKNNIIDNTRNTTVSNVNGENVTLKSIHFPVDVYSLSEDDLLVTTENANKIKIISSKGDTFKIKLEGDCDESGSDEYNYALGLKRAISVKNDLINRGINADRIVTFSYGESNPICKEHTAECFSKNRRTDYFLLP